MTAERSDAETVTAALEEVFNVICVQNQTTFGQLMQDPQIGNNWEFRCGEVFFSAANLRDIAKKLEQLNARK